MYTNKYYTMPTINQFDDDRFQQALEDLLLAETPKVKILSTTKASEAKVDEFITKIYDDWLDQSDIKIDSRRVKVLKQMSYLFRMAHDSFIKSRKTHKRVYKNNINDTDNMTVNEVIYGAGPGDPKWLSIMADIAKWTYTNTVQFSETSFNPEIVLMDIERKFKEQEGTLDD